MQFEMSLHNARAYQRQVNVTVVRGEAAGPTVYDYLPTVTTISLGSVQVLCGVTLLALSIAGLLVQSSLLATGADDAILSIIAGSFAIAAGRTKTACKIASNLVLSTMAVFCSTAVFIVALTHVASGTKSVCPNEYDCFARLYEIRAQYSISIAQAVVAAIESLAALVSAIVSCHFVCFCCKNCCCEFDVTKTEQIALLDDHEDTVTELRQVLTVPALNYPETTPPNSMAFRSGPPPEYKMADT